MRLISILNAQNETTDKAKQRRVEKFTLAILGGATPFLPFIIRGDKGWNFALGVYFLTAMSFGSILYFKHAPNLREKWLWKAMVPSVAVQVVFITALFYFDRAAHPTWVRIIVDPFELVLAFVLDCLLIAFVFGLFQPPKKKEGHGKKVSA